MEPAASRRSIRLAEYDYSLEGAYFITICLENKEHRFGHITDGVMHLNEAGQMIEERILAISAKFPGTLIDSYVVMPNHIHFIISLLGYQPIGLIVPDGGYVGAAHRGRPLSGSTATADDMHPNMPAANVPGNEPGNTGDPDGPKAGTHDGAPLHIYHPTSTNNPGHINPPTSINQAGRNQSSVSDVVGWFKANTTNYYIKGVKAGTYPVFDKRLWQRNYYEHIIRTESAYNQIDEYIRANPGRWAEDRLR